MADTPIVHIGENSPEYVALKLLAAVAQAEDTKIVGLCGGSKMATKAYILDTYAECLVATTGDRMPKT